MLSRILWLSLAGCSLAFVANHAVSTSTRKIVPVRTSVRMARGMTESEKKEKYWQVRDIMML